MMKPEEQLTSGVICMLLQLEGALPTQTESQISDFIYTSVPAKPDEQSSSSKNCSRNTLV